MICLMRVLIAASVLPLVTRVSMKVSTSYYQAFTVSHGFQALGMSER